MLHAPVKFVNIRNILYYYSYYSFFDMNMCNYVIQVSESFVHDKLLHKKYTMFIITNHDLKTVDVHVYISTL